MLTITYTQLNNDMAALDPLISPSTFGISVTGVTAANSLTTSQTAHVTSVLVSDTAAHVQTSIDTLESVASAGKIFTRVAIEVRLASWS